jgi:hypothetical protein
MSGDGRRRFLGLHSLIVWCLAATLLVWLAPRTVIALLVVVPCVLLGPGIALVLLLRLPGLVLRLTVILLAGIAAGILVPSILLYARAWSPVAAFAIVMAGTILAAGMGIYLDFRQSRAGRNASAQI